MLGTELGFCFILLRKHMQVHEKTLTISGFKGTIILYPGTQKVLKIFLSPKPGSSLAEVFICAIFSKPLKFLDSQNTSR